MIREQLEMAIQQHWHHDHCHINVCDRFEVNPEVGYPSPVGGRTVLVYELEVKDRHLTTVLERPSAWLWFDNAIVNNRRCKVAFLYLLAIKQQWRRQGIGSAFINTKSSSLPQFGVNIIYLEAGYEGPRFWFKRGFNFTNPEKFWTDYAEYCEYNELQFSQNIDDIEDEYFEYLKASNLTYNMFYILNHADLPSLTL